MCFALSVTLLKTKLKTISRFSICEQVFQINKLEIEHCLSWCQVATISLSETIEARAANKCVRQKMLDEGAQDDFGGKFFVCLMNGRDEDQRNAEAPNDRLTKCPHSPSFQTLWAHCCFGHRKTNSKTVLSRTLLTLQFKWMKNSNSDISLAIRVIRK